MFIEKLSKIQKLYLSGDLTLEEVHTIIASVLFLRDNIRLDWPDLETGEQSMLTEDFRKMYGEIAYRKLIE